MSSSNRFKCSTPCENKEEEYCLTCKQSICEKCDHFGNYTTDQHILIPFETATEYVKKEVSHIQKIASKIKVTLEKNYKLIIDNSSDFNKDLRECRESIEQETELAIRKIREKRDELKSYLDNILKQHDEAMENDIKELDSNEKMMKKLLTTASKAIKPREIEKIDSCKKKIIDLRSNVLSTYYVKSPKNVNLVPTFIPSKELDEGLVLGEIFCIDRRYMIHKNDQALTVTEGQHFFVNVSRLIENNTCKVSATLRKVSGLKSVAEVEDLRNGKYIIKCRCDEEGEWEIKIRAGVAQVRGSPVKVIVEPLGLVKTTDSIATYKQENKEYRVRDVMFDKDECFLVSTKTNDLLKFSSSGSFVSKIQLPDDVKINRMYKMDSGHLLFGNVQNECVEMYNDEFVRLMSFGKGTIKYPTGLAVNEESRILYVADWECHCVFKFNVDDSRFLGKIGSKSKREGEIKCPIDVIINREGNVIVLDWQKSKMKMFDENGKFVKILVDIGHVDSKICHPLGLTMDVDGNIIVTSEEKVQLFNKHGNFIRRIDKNDTSRYSPGVSVISNRPRRIALGSTLSNNIKIFNF